ncbi:hypothetical protein [Clostridium sp. LCP25S3_F10]|uniref:hypothetical protein n=1 Tax=Clostridium sp. LCP25S3_F10 TaxID=3438750 RepID=UPI003F912AC4
MRKLIKYFSFVLIMFGMLAVNKSNVSAKEIANNQNQDIPPIQNLGGGPSHYIVGSETKTFTLTYNQIGVMVNDIQRRSEQVSKMDDASFILGTVAAFSKYTPVAVFSAGTTAFVRDYVNYWRPFTDQTSNALSQASGALYNQKHRKAIFKQKYKVLETGQRILDGGVIYVGIQ